MQNLTVAVEMTPEQLRVFRQKWIDQTAQGLVDAGKIHDGIAEARTALPAMHISVTAGADADGGLVPMRPAIDRDKQHASQMKAADDKTRDESLGRALRYTAKFTPVL